MKNNPPIQLELNLDNPNKEPITPTYFQDKVSGPEKIKIEKRIATFGDSKSNGAWKAHVARNQRYEAEQKEKEKLKSLVKFGVENSSTPVSKAPQGSKRHKSDVISYIEKMNEIYGNGKESADPVYPNQATPTQVGELAKRLEESRQMTGEPSTWDLMRETAKTPEEKNDIKRILNKQYYKHGPKDMDPADLKFIGKHKSQNIPLEIKVPPVETNLINKPTPPPRPRPQIPVEQTIKALADRKLVREQKDWDRQWGRGGISDVLRPV